MAYLYSLALRVSNNTLAPLKVAFDKSYDVLTYSENTKGITGDNANSDNKGTIVNVDGIDSQTTIKKMERLYPQTNVFAGYVHFFSGPTQVYNGLYLGSAYNASCWYTLEKFNIKYIINVTSEISNYYESSGITYYRIPIRDDNNESIQSYFDESYKKIEEFLRKNDGNVLVHCYMGASRSATVVARFISKKQEVDITEVIANLTERRPIVNPTQQFIKDLIVETSV
jgi:hypothetical protein